MIVIKKVPPEKIADIIQFNIDIFCAEQDIPKDLIEVSEELKPQWWGMFDNDIIIGSICIWTENDKTHMGRYAIKKEYRGQKLGTDFAKFVLNDVFMSGIENVFLEARDETVKIMERLGAKAVSEPFEFFKGNVTPIVISSESFNGLNHCSCCEK